MTISLGRAKEHLGILDFYQDTLVTGLLQSASDMCLRFIGGPSEAPDPLPDTYEAAVLMTMTALFEGREGASIPQEAQALLWDFRPWVFG